jgi:protein-S-isoprenylcysteine O-methyltransferase Ste14
VNAEAPIVSRKILPPIWVLLVLGAELSLNHWLPVVRLVPAPWNLIGWAVVAKGVVIILWAWSLFKRTGTGIKPFSPSTALVVSGPYRFSRNPMYLGMATLLLGAAVVMGSLTPFVGPVLFVLIITFRFIRFEEQHMERAFGADYLDMKKRVRRWL